MNLPEQNPPSPERQPRAAKAIENDVFIGGDEATWLEQINARTPGLSFWSEMAKAVPEESEVFERNQQLIETTLDVIAGRLPATGRITDIRDRCMLFFERLGSINGLRGTKAREAMVKVASRYLEAAVTNNPDVNSDATSFNLLPTKLMNVLSKEESRNTAFAAMQPDERVWLGCMLREIAGSYDGESDDPKNRALRNHFEQHAIHAFRFDNTVTARDIPRFATDSSRRAWAYARDIEVNRLLRQPESPERQAAFEQLLAQEVEEVELLLKSGSLPQGRATDGWLYEYYLPSLVRFAALQFDQTSNVLIRQALPREDSPIDGMTHPQRPVEYEKYSFDFLLQYPNHGRKVFLQTKIGRDTEGYVEGIDVFNFHTAIPDLRAHMLRATAAMRADLAGQRVAPEDQKLLRQELQRVSSLLPEL